MPVAAAIIAGIAAVSGGAQMISASQQSKDAADKQLKLQQEAANRQADLDAESKRREDRALKEGFMTAAAARDKGSIGGSQKAPMSDTPAPAMGGKTLIGT